MIFLLATLYSYGQTANKDSTKCNLRLFEKTIRKEMGYSSIVATFGRPDINTGSGLYILIYYLADSSSIIINCDNKRILSAKTHNKYGVEKELIQDHTESTIKKE